MWSIHSAQLWSRALDFPAEPYCILIIIILKWFPSALTTQEPLKIGSFNSIPIIRRKRDFGEWLFNLYVT